MALRPLVIALLTLAACGPVGAKSLLPPGSGAASRRLSAPADTACASYGPGFVRVGGSDTCVKLGGAVRAEYGLTTGAGGDGRR